MTRSDSHDHCYSVYTILLSITTVHASSWILVFYLGVKYISVQVATPIIMVLGAVLGGVQSTQYRASNHGLPHTVELQLLSNLSSPISMIFTWAS